MVKSQAEAKTEGTSASEQHVIAGADKISGAEVAKRKAGQPLKPQVAQKPADHGLFSDESKQIDFIDEPVASPQVESTTASGEERIWKIKQEYAHAILKEGIKVSCSDSE